MQDNRLAKNSFSLAIGIVRLGNKLMKENKEYIISRQLIRSGTSIGSNINESKYAISKPDFINKLHIFLKECNETEYWLKLLLELKYQKEETEKFIRENNKIRIMLISALKTAKQKD